MSVDIRHTIGSVQLVGAYRKYISNRIGLRGCRWARGLTGIGGPDISPESPDYFYNREPERKPPLPQSLMACTVIHW